MRQEIFLFQHRRQGIEEIRDCFDQCTATCNDEHELMFMERGSNVTRADPLRFFLSLFICGLDMCIE